MATLTLTPNSYGVRALPHDIRLLLKKLRLLLALIMAAIRGVHTASDGHQLLAAR